MDPSLPLTVLDYEEFGNPQIESHFHSIMKYSPYDNISRGTCYPAMLVTASFHDSRYTHLREILFILLCFLFQTNYRSSKNAIKNKETLWFCKDEWFSKNWGNILQKINKSEVQTRIVTKLENIRMVKSLALRSRVKSHVTWLFLCYLILTLFLFDPPYEN